MPDTDMTLQTKHVAVSEDVPDQAITAALLQAVLRAPRHDAGSILTAMLHHGQRVIQPLVNRLRTDNSYHATHGFVSP
jgi:hypothetical protein